MSRKDIEIMDTKMLVFTRDGWRCRYCGAGGHLQLAHRIPQTKANIAKYGKEIIHHPDNLETTCPTHNSQSLVGQDRTLEAEIVAHIKTKLEDKKWKNLR